MTDDDDRARDRLEGKSRAELNAIAALERVENPGDLKNKAEVIAAIREARAEDADLAEAERDADGEASERSEDGDQAQPEREEHARLSERVAPRLCVRCERPTEKPENRLCDRCEARLADGPKPREAPWPGERRRGGELEHDYWWTPGDYSIRGGIR